MSPPGPAEPSVVTLEKLLDALGMDMASFFGAMQAVTPNGPVYRREAMQLVADDERSYTLLFPKSPAIGLEMLDEQLQPGQPKPSFEALREDIAGCVLSGALVIEVEGEGGWELRPGDAFYLPAGVSHRGYALSDAPVRLITVSPAKSRDESRPQVTPAVQPETATPVLVSASALK